MALPFTEDTIKWSDDTFSIRDVADSNLPTVVKVADGFYSENEAESFSNGDLIKLDFKKNYSKVRAQCVGRTPREDSSGYMSPDKDILIPLGYKGKLKVECMKKTFNTIEELIAHFPHYVTTGRPLTGKRGVYSSEQFRIEKGVRLELDRVIPKAGLVCKIDGKEVLLPLGQLARFDVEADDKEYTIREVIDSFKLPQYVRFLDSDFEKIVTSDLTEAIDNISHFEGYLRLVGLVQQEVVVGHHKPSGIAAITSEKANQRAIAILPLDSEAVQNIEVYLPVYEEESDYEFFLARNFSKNMNLDVVDGGLYLEFSKCPRIHLLNTEDDDDTPPPRPPPPPGYASSRDLSIPKATPQRPDAPHFQDSDKAKTRRNPPQVPRSSKPKTPVKILTDPKADDFSDDDSDNPYEEIPEVHEIEDYSKKTGLDFTKLPKTFRVGLKKVHHELKKLKRSHSTELKHPSTKENHVLPSKDDLCLGEIRSSDDDDDGLVEYDYPDLTKLASMRRPPPSGDDPRYQSSPKPKPPKPVGKIQPMSHGTSDLMKFSDMTTGEVVDLFKQTMLPALASACEKEGLDGSFLSSLSDTQLKTVFKLSDLQLIKVNKIINDGWRPHIN
ncbi:uncharacterized protein [Magallana gigas]|uniref:uncharacterized protein isoform X5 n=1 Tax=Magallana gigas TaxID=29159 RepID=UPI003340930F